MKTVKPVPETRALNEIVVDWIKRAFSRRKLCFVFFYFEEKGPDLKRPVAKMEPYIVYCNPKEKGDKLAPLFMTKVPKGRTIRITNVVIQPVGRVEVV